MYAKCTRCRSVAYVCDCSGVAGETEDARLLKANARITSLTAQIERLREGLRKLEWDRLGRCPGCNCIDPQHADLDTRHAKEYPDLYKHAPDCWLAAIIKEPK
jgi:hypothetical protein